MSNTPDFEALRAQRNAAVQAEIQRLAAKLPGLDVSSLHTSHNPDACYCACTTGGPCEHRWDSEPAQEGGLWTTTCSRCGMWAFSHSLRTGE
jgi:hypothetical protein